jgi:hypothetical protein
MPGGDGLGPVGVLAAGHVLVDAVEHPALAAHSAAMALGARGQSAGSSRTRGSCRVDVRSVQKQRSL